MKRASSWICFLLTLTVLLGAVPVQAAPSAQEQIALYYQELEQLHEKLFQSQTEAEFEAASSRIREVLDRLDAIPEYRQTVEKAEQELKAAFEAKAQADRDTLGLSDAQDRGDFTAAAVSWSQIQKGDVLHINNKKFFNLYAMYYSHSGMSDGSGWVYESITDGVYRRSDSTWRGSGRPVALGRATSKSASTRAAALDSAKAQYGTDGRTPYNWVFINKTTDERLYCSQLVWKVHLRMGLDVDSNHSSYIAWMRARYGDLGESLVYPMVAPDEIYLSSHITYYSVGVG